MRTTMIRRWLAATVTITMAGLGIGLAAAPAYAANLVANPGFESGSLSPWTCATGLGSVQATTVHSGTKALQGNPSGSDVAKCAQTIPVVANSAYTLTMWARGGGGYVYLGVTGGTSTWSPSSASAWTKLTVTYTTTASQTSLEVYVTGWYGQPVYYADDFDLEGPAGGSGGGPSAPGTPGTPTAGAATGTSIPLSWAAATGTVTGYRVYEGTTVKSTGTGTSATITGLAACSTHTYNVTAYNSTGESAHSGNVTATTTGCSSGGGTGSYTFAPYEDTDQRQDIATVAAAGNTKYLTLAFMLANGSACSGGWNGGTRDQTWINAITAGIASLRSAGGDVILSFGGANGTELAQACTSVSALTSAYAAVVDTYHLTHIDFDIEGAAVADPASINRRSQALVALEQSHPGLNVSLTLPVLPTGLDANGLSVVQSAHTYGLNVSVVNIMAMDYGQWAAPDGNQMGTYAQQAAQATHDQLASIYTNLTDAQLWAMVGVTPMIGVNDTCWSTYCELFTVADASNLVTFARQHHLGRLAMWSITRDVPCRDAAGNVVTHTYADPSCSSIAQANYAFSQAFSAYTG
jgi:Carbohydrate binding domain/Glycosyl hydrolases family 18